MWQCTFDMDRSWVQDAILGRLVVEEQILPVKLLLQNILDILEAAKRVKIVQCLAFWGHSGFRSMTIYPESKIAITGKPSPRSVWQQLSHHVFSLVRMAFTLTLVSHIRICSVYLYKLKKDHPGTATTQLSAAITQAKQYYMLICHGMACWDFVFPCFLHSPCELDQ